MLAEIGYISLLASGFSAVLLAFLPYLIRLRNKHISLVTFTVPLSYLLFFWILVSFSILITLMLQDDFSVQYVANHSNSLLPLFYKIAASWGGHSGSMLFLLLTLSFWIAVFAFVYRQNSSLLITYSLSMLGLIALSFILFLLFLSNPFERIFPAPLEGGDLNPMLQDIGLIFHPPLLYLGYSAFAIVFSLTMGLLIEGKFSFHFSKLIRPWLLLGWSFLTFGIVLGAWWAYYELGWGGWWFWDPTENSSLMPWLIATALIHSIYVNYKNNAFPYWVILLSILVFLLSLLGVFIVRSGILTSVHSFTQDNNRGIALLGIFTFFSFISLLLFSLRVKLKTTIFTGNIIYFYTLLFANILFSLGTFIVFLGTFYPLFYQILGLGSISVGAPYFNKLFIPIILMSTILMIFTTILFDHKWKIGKWECISAVLSLVLTLCIFNYYEPISYTDSWQMAICLVLAFYLILLTLRKLQYKKRNIGMILAHIGLGCIIFSSTMSHYFGFERSVALAVGDTFSIKGYDIKYKGTKYLLQNNYTSEQAYLQIEKDEHLIAEILPEKRHYDMRNIQMSEIGIASRLTGDFYIVMGEKRSNGTFTFRIQYKPFMLWLWIGGILMVVGGFLAIAKKKYYA